MTTDIISAPHIVKFGSIHENADGVLVFSGFHVDGSTESLRVAVIRA